MIEFRLKGVNVEALDMLDEYQKGVMVSILVSKAKIEADGVKYKLAKSNMDTAIRIEDGIIVVPVRYA